MGLRLHRPIAAEDPDDPAVPVAPPEPLPVDGRVRGGEDLGALAPLLVPLVAPRGQEADVEAERVGLLDHEVDVIPVVVRGALLHVRPRGVVVEEGQVPVGVRVPEPVELGERHRLNHGEALARPVLEVAVRLLAVQPVEELPRRVAEVEERPPVLVDEEPPVLAHLEARRGALRRGGGGGEGKGRAAGSRSA